MSRHNEKPFSTWFAGTEKDWRSLSYDAQKDAAFAGCGCEVAFPTWDAPTNCYHITCRIRRGERPPIALTHAVLRGERERGYLRFGDRDATARIYRAVRARAKATGVYDPWQMNGGWQVMVSAAVASIT